VGQQKTNALRRTREWETGEEREKRARLSGSAGGRKTIVDVSEFSLDAAQQLAVRGESGSGETAVLPRRS